MVIDTSAIMAILMGEAERLEMMEAIRAAPTRRLSVAATLELTIVVSGKKAGHLLARIDRLLQQLNITIEPVTLQQALIAQDCFLTYGKGRHKARLNFGDTFSYALAKATGEPLLFKGDDFTHTDITPAV